MLDFSSLFTLENVTTFSLYLELARVPTALLLKIVTLSYHDSALAKASSIVSTLGGGGFRRSSSASCFFFSSSAFFSFAVSGFLGIAAKTSSIVFTV